MHRYIDFLGLELGAWGLMLMLGVISTLVLFKYLCTSDGVPTKSYEFYSILGFISVVIGILFAYLFDNFYKFLEHRTWGLGGFTLMGGVVGGVGTFVIGTILVTDSKHSPHALGTGLGLFGAALGMVLLANPLNSLFASGLIGLVVLGSIGVFGGIQIRNSASYGLLAMRVRPQFKRDFWGVTNKGVIGVVLGDGIGRIGCFMAGCCYGASANDSLLGFLGVEFQDGESVGRVFPTQLFESIFMFGLFAFMMATRKKFKHQVLIFGYAYSIFRFFIEFLRDDDRGGTLLGMSPSQIQTLIFLAITIVLTIYIYVKKRVPFDAINTLDAKQTSSNTSIA